MTLPIAKTPKKTLLSDQTILIHGMPKIGKSTFCSGADGAIFLATEPGLNSLEVFQVPEDGTGIKTWEELLTACAELATGNHKFKTVIIDTVDNMAKLCADYVCRKWKIEDVSDLEHSKGYALVNGELLRVLTKLGFLSSGLFLVSHSKDKEIKTATKKYARVVPSLSEGVRKIIVGMADIILFFDIEEEMDEASGKPIARRVLRTQPSLYYEAGDKTGRLPAMITLPIAVTANEREIGRLDFAEFLKAFEAGEPAGTTNTATARAIDKRLNRPEGGK
jgi:hypothetical protein